MNEIVNNVERILENYNISFKNLTEHKTKMLLMESTNPTRLRRFVQEQFHKDIKMEEAKELEILLLTYQYIAHN
jgi:hypothetical protein